MSGVTGSSKVGSLAIEHFKELKEAWQYEHDEHKRLKVFVFQLSNDIAELEAKISFLESNTELESIRLCIVIYYFVFHKLLLHTA